MSQHLNLTVADISFQVAADNPSVFLSLKHIFNKYVSTHEPSFQINFIGSLPDQTPSRQPHPIHIIRTGYLFTVIEEAPQPLPLLTFREQDHIFSCQLNQHSHLNHFIGIIRNLFQYHLDKAGGFLMHAACGMIAGRGFAIVGKSGTGKTTALHNSRPDRIIAEDVTAVNMRYGDPFFFATPFWGDLPTEIAAKAVLFPNKNSTLKLLPAPYEVSYMELIGSAFFAMPKDQSYIDQVVRNISHINQLLTSFQLYSNRLDNIHQILHQHLV